MAMCLGASIVARHVKAWVNGRSKVPWIARSNGSRKIVTKGASVDQSCNAAQPNSIKDDWLIG
jgi:hypothetical protein